MNSLVEGTEGPDLLQGTGNDYLRGLGGNDILVAAGAFYLDGGNGFDIAVFDKPLGAYSILPATGQAHGAVDRTNNTQTIWFEVERVAFADAVLAWDIDGAAGQGYRLYRASFDRTPDQHGLSVNVHVLDNGMSMHNLAAAFLVSQEFVDKYGSNLTNGQFITQLYANVLHRAPDQPGFEGWNAILASGQADRATVLTGFSESIENKIAVAENIITQGGQSNSVTVLGILLDAGTF